MQSFLERVKERAEVTGNWLCVGIDPDPRHFPHEYEVENVREFCLEVLDAVREQATTIKPNVAFFEALGEVGEDALRALITACPPEIPVILDGKRNDIGNTASKYAEAAFDELGADAVTVTPYLGLDTVEPFASYEDKGIFLLARTSNKSAGDFQDLRLENGRKLFEQIVIHSQEKWQPKFGNLGYVAGATYPEELQQIRKLVGDNVPLLIPGVGAQGADGPATIRAGADSNGECAIVNVGRAILYAGKEEDWSDRVRAAAREFSLQLRSSPIEHSG